MPTFRITAPDGTAYNVTGPDGSTADQALAQVQAQHASAPTEQTGGVAALGAGLGKGFGQVALNAQNYIGKGVSALGGIGHEKTLSDLIAPPQGNMIQRAGQWLQNDAQSGLAKIEGEAAPYKKDHPILEGGGEIGGNVIATLPVGGLIAKGVSAIPGVASAAPGLVSAIRTSGMTAGEGGNALANLGVRAAGGAITGGASGALVDPNQASTGAVIGGALPFVAKAAGAAGNALGRVFKGADQAPEAASAIQAARDAGYVIPPTQANPTLANRALEGFSGKLTTAQNASARNQAVTNSAAARAIGLPEGAQITPEALDAVRAEAGKAYAAISKLGPLDAAGAKLPADVSVKSFTDPLTMGPRSTVDAGELVRAWKQANSNATSYYRAYGRDANPETLAKAKAAAADAKSVDDFLNKSLTTAPEVGGKSSDQLITELSKGYISPGDFLRQSVAKPAEGEAVAAKNQDLLDALKAARVRIAKTYSVEAAMNPATGTVDANVLAKQLAKGKVLTGDLKSAADFASRFPKAAQTPERMGSLPGSSPLDFAAAGGMSAATGNPLMMASVLARPAARSLTLSPMVQNRLIQSGGDPNALMQLLSNEQLAQLGYRVAPAALGAR